MEQKNNRLLVSSDKGVDINKGMIGLFFEDINYGADGGIYAEMIENRNFEFLDARGDKDAYYQNFDGLYGWTSYPNDKVSVLKILSDKPYSHINPHYLRVIANDNNCGFTNKAYDGIYLEKDKSYNLNLIIKGNEYSGNIIIEVVKDNVTYASGVIEKLHKNWSKYSVTITATETVRFGEFVIKLSTPGCVEFDYISMMPADAVLGLFRRDLTELLKDIKPGFLRFPGGCIVEGNELSNRYKWKESIGPNEHRKANWNRWAVHGNSKENHFEGPYSHYNQTLGLGYFEYFLLSEFLEAKPIPILNVGLACQYQSTEKVSADSEEFNEFIQDALDLIEFANGDESTEWGRKRIEMGHSEPFGLEYLGIGNEQWETSEVDYFKRYELFEKAIHSKYPEIKLISSAGPNVKSETYDKAWKWIREKAKENPDFTAAIDEHYYVPPQWCYDNIDFYDNYPRDVKVFAGEYAAHVGSGMNRPEVNSMEAALAEAAFMTGLEKNADVVVLAAYAPLVARLSYTQWSPDLIWFDDCKAYGTPSYYVQKMYGNNMGTYTLTSKLDAVEGVYSTTSYDEENNEIIVKVINKNSTALDITLQIDEAYKLASTAISYELASKELTDYNTIDESKITMVEKRIEGISNTVTLSYLPYSFTVLRLKVK